MAITFNESYYLQNNPDVLSAVTLGVYKSGADHFNKIGGREGRNPNAVFDSKYYAAQNPDVAAAVSAGTFASAYAHYIANGLREGRAPNATLKGFDGADYIAKNADVAAAGFTAATALQHYVQFGVDENRSFTSSTAGAVTGNVSGTTGDDTITPAGGQANTIRVEGGQQGAVGDTLVITSGSASSFQVVDLSNNGGDQNQTRDNTNGNNTGAKVGPVVQGFENVDGRQSTINLNLTAIDRTSVTNTGSVASAQTGSVLQGGTGRDTLTGNAGNDVITGNDGNDAITGAAGNDSLSGGVGADTIGGGAGADVISDGTGDDVVTGDAGADVITVDAGTNSIDGGADNDTITLAADQATSTTVSTISGGAGDDTITLNATAITAASRSSVSGGAGNDTITAGLGVETINAGAGNDTVKFTSTNLGATDVFNGNDGQDIIQLEIPTGAGTNTFVFTPAGSTNATTQFAGFEAIALIDSSGNTNAKSYKINLTDTFLANNLVNGSFLIDARGLPGGSNIVIDFSALTAASAARFTAGAFRVLTSPSTDVRDQNNVGITATYSVQTGNALLNNVLGFAAVYTGDTTTVAGSAAAYNTDRTVNTGTGQATYTTVGGTAETSTVGGGTVNFTQTAATGILTTSANVGFGSGFLTSGSDIISSPGVLTAAGSLVVQDLTVGDADRLDLILTVNPTSTTIQNIETLNINSFGGTLSFASITAGQTTNITGTSFTATNLANAQTLNVGAVTALQTYDLASEAGSADSITINLNGAVTGSSFDIGNGALETINLVVQSATTTTIADLTNAATAANIVITGSANLALTNADTTANNVFNAGAFTGNLTLTTGSLAAGATVLVTGGSGNDTLSIDSNVFAATTGFNGGVGTDTLALTGNTAQGGVTMTAVAGIEAITIANTTTNVQLTSAEANVAAGTVLTVTTSQTTGALTFVGTAETDGGRFSITGGGGADSLVGGTSTDTIIGGAGNDSITGGAGSDALTGGAGNDTFVFAAGVTDTVSTAVSIVGVDRITDLTLNAATADLIDLTVVVANVGTAVTGALNEATFVANMNTLLNVAGGAGFNTTVAGTITAAVVTATSGTLSGRTFLAVDLDGSDTFTATDYVVEITGATLTSVTTASFV